MNACSLRLVSLALGIAACGSAPSEEPRGDGSRAPERVTAALFADDRVLGAYAVPVDDPALSAVASNPVRVDLRSREGNELRMKYYLPRFLVGTPQEVDLVGVRTGAGPWTMSGPAGTATCSESAAGEVRCDEVLDGVTVDLPAVAAALRVSGFDDTERARRLQVAERFSVDPLGVLTFSREGSEARGGR